LGYSGDALARIIFSRILPKTGKRLKGLYEEGFSGGLPVLSTVTMTVEHIYI